LTVFIYVSEYNLSVSVRHKPEVKKINAQWDSSIRTLANPSKNFHRAAVSHTRQHSPSNLPVSCSGVTARDQIRKFSLIYTKQITQLGRILFQNLPFVQLPLLKNPTVHLLLHKSPQFRPHLQPDE